MKSPSCIMLSGLLPVVSAAERIINNECRALDAMHSTTKRTHDSIRFRTVHMNMLLPKELGGGRWSGSGSPG